MKYGPDGTVYMIDWYDLNQCHSPNPAVHDKTTGRIFRVAYGDVKPVKVDLEKMTDAELVKLQEKKNEWYPRMARRILQERKNAGKIGDDSTALILQRPFDVKDPTLKLRAKWAAFAIDGLQVTPFDLEDPYVAGWVVRLMGEGHPGITQRIVLDELEKAESITEFTAAPQSRLAMASLTFRIDPSRRWKLVEVLLKHAEDAQDHNLPLMYWYALEPMTVADGKRALALAIDSKIPKLREFVSRRLAETTRKATQN
jgi:hypothetical protein